MPFTCPRKLQVRGHYVHGDQVDADFLEAGKPCCRVILPTLAVVATAPVVGAFSGVVQPVPVNLREVLRITTDQGHVLLGAVRLHPRTEDLKDRAESMRGEGLGNAPTPTVPTRAGNMHHTATGTQPAP